ncbi:MAG: response regulator [Fibromonadaceae bacterium]|jgi:PAS domain S-box-containing protein|nr:response regulator [Fibromonadaceae bacterium]
MQIMRKIKAIITMYLQVILVFVTFSAMVVSTYILMRGVEYDNMKREANSVLSNMHNNLMLRISEPKIVVKKTSDIIGQMLEQNVNFKSIREYVKDFNRDRNFSQYIISSYVFLDESPTDSIWYKEAFDAAGEVVVKERFDKSLNSIIIAYVCRIFDKTGTPRGFVGLNVNFEDVMKLIENSQIAEGGFGLMFNKNFEMLAHIERKFVGNTSLIDNNIGIAKFKSEFENNLEIIGRDFVNYRGEKSVAFFRQLDNGWYFGIITPEHEYYKNINKIAKYLSMLGVLFTLALSVVLIRIINVREGMNKLVRDQKLELETTVHRYRSILNAVPLPITVTDLDTKWTFINTAVERFLGITLKEALGKPCSNWNANICNTQNCGIECAKRGLKQTFFTHNGSSFKVDVEVLRNVENEPMGYIEVVQDITQVEKMARAEAENASAAKTAFLAKMSHEIRTPMNAIMGVTEIQLRNETLIPQVRESFAIIYNSGNLLLGIINNILDLSKIEAGKMELIPVEYEFVGLIHDVVQLNAMRNNSKPIKFELYIDENVPLELVGDEIRIKQILNNLLSNAFKYTEKGKVKLSIFAENNEKDTILILQVSDTGCGMSREQVNKLFTSEYVRFNLEANRSIEGTGLGMAITQHLVQMMNGKIFADSKIGKGSTFTIHLPQKNTGVGILGEKRAKDIMSLRIDKTSIKKVQLDFEQMPYGKVMVVDDVESNLYVAKEMMAHYGLTIEAVSSGFEAIDRVKKGEVYDIIFMDHMMPKMDGMETTKILRESGYTHPIVALTANALIGQAKIFMENGFDDFISKPIDIRQLNTVLNRFIRNKQPSETIVKTQESTSEEPKAAAPAVNPVLLSFFVKDATNALPVLESSLANIETISDDDLQLYAVTAHGMKSALINIGNTELSDLALTLEKAGKAKDKDVIKQKTQELVDELKKIIESVPV